MSVFCDFLTIYQQHDPASVPDLNAGRVVKLVPPAFAADDEDGWRAALASGRVQRVVDAHGEIVADGLLEFTTAMSITHEGSYETSVQVKSEGGRVTLSGNIGRYGRSDNVFGYSVLHCVRLANLVLASLGLPPFTWNRDPVNRVRERIGMPPLSSGRRNGNRQGGDSSLRLDAVITRVDLTCNYAAGSPDKLSRLLHYMGGMHVGSKPGKSYAAGVTWGEGSKWWYAKLYDKAAEIAKDKHVPAELLAWVRDSGIGRFEVSLKTRYLAQHGLNYVGVWEDVKMGDVVFGRFSGPLSKCDVSVDDFEEIPGRLGELAIAWRNGVDLKDRLPRATFYRYRKQLKSYGIDISERCDVSRLPMRFETVTLTVASFPEWYGLPPIPLAA